MIGAPILVETDCLPLLGMIINCNTPDIAMLRWIAYIKTLNPEFKHIKGKYNVVADMLSRARFEDEEDLIEDIDDVGTTFYSMAQKGEGEYPRPFEASLYEGEWLDIGYYLSTLAKHSGWSDTHFKRVRRKAYNYLLQDGYLWKCTKQEMPQRVICKRQVQLQLIKEFHESLWAGHRGIYATFTKIKERYWWPNMHRDVVGFVETCQTCQMYSGIRHRDELHPTYPLSLHYKWVVDLVIMLVGLWKMRYLVLAWEDLSNQVEGRALKTKAIEGVCKFLLEDVICRYGWVGKIIVDRGELNTAEAKEFFEKCGVKLALTTTYNPEGNAKSERGHAPIVKVIVKACRGRSKEWPRVLPFALWADKITHNSVMGYMLAELIQGQKSIMPIEDQIPTWSLLP